METQNITLSIPREILRKAKMLALQRNTSLSRLLSHAIEDIVVSEEGYLRAQAAHLAWLSRGADLGTRGRIAWTREGLHER